MEYKFKLLISFGIGVVIDTVLTLVFALSVGWSWIRSISDAALIIAIAYAIVFLFLASIKSGRQGRKRYYKLKREAQKKKVFFEYSSFDDFLAKQPEVKYKPALAWIPALAFFAVSIIFTVIFVYA